MEPQVELLMMAQEVGERLFYTHTHSQSMGLSH